MTAPIVVCSTWHSQPRSAQALRDQIVPEVRVAGVDVDGDDREVDRRALAQHVENLDQRPAVLAARQADHDAVAVLDQAELDDRARRLLGEPRFERRAITHRLPLGTHERATPSDHARSRRTTVRRATTELATATEPLDGVRPGHARDVALRPCAPRRSASAAVVAQLGERGARAPPASARRRGRSRRRGRTRAGRRCRWHVMTALPTRTLRPSRSRSPRSSARRRPRGTAPGARRASSSLEPAGERARGRRRRVRARAAAAAARPPLRRR